jgi:uncharacterized protein (TIGR04141 family)
MAGSLPPLQALTIFLLKELEDPRKALKAAGRLQRIEIDANHTVFIKRTQPRPPSWAEFFEDYVNLDMFGRVKSAGAVLLCAAAGRHFAVTFGTGRTLLDQSKIEQRFGLLATLNSVDPRKVRSIDKASLDRQGMQSRIQAGRDSSTKDFGIDVEQDLVRAVAGTPSDALLGETIAGFDSLHVNARIEFGDLRGKLEAYLQKSQANVYQKEFGWIDHVREVRDEKLAVQLTRQLIKDIKSSHSVQCWMAPYQIIDWNEVSCFQFGTAQGAPRFSNLTLERYIEHIGGIKKLTLETLERGQVRALRADDMVAHDWPAQRCLQAELQFGKKSYLLSSGKWYQIDEDFVASIDRIVGSIPTCDVGLPAYNDATEGKYNERVADSSQDRFALVDADMVRHGGGRSSIEFCDLYSLERDMIHVKRYSGSGTLSHLFSQASVSGQLFKSDAAFREKVNTKLPASHRVPDPKAPILQGDYRVIIAVVGGPTAFTKLPFFSRVTLKHTFTQLDAYGYKVAVTHIPLEERFAQSSSIRERAKRQRRGGAPSAMAAMAAMAARQ